MNRAAPQRPKSLVARWWSAARPATLWAGIVPVMIGALIAHYEGANLGWPTLLALAGAIFIQLATNFVNDYADAQKGADGSNRLGPPRAGSMGWISIGQLKQAAFICLFLSVLIGVFLVKVGGWPILVLGVLSVISAVAYTAGPFPLAYLGLGDVFVLLFFGLGAVVGTSYLETGILHLSAVLAGVALGCLATAILVVNNLRDRHSDAEVGKRTLAVRFGAKFTRLEYFFLLLTAYLCVVLGCVFGVFPVSVLLVGLSIPFALFESKRVWTNDGAALNQSLAATARLELIFGLCLSLGLIL
jgi:1,4-dihydroxy-2-naphthoate octaprenyltransferase